MRRAITTAVALAATAAMTTGLTTATANGAPAAERASAKRDAGFAMKAAGFGTRLYGGQLPVGSGQTAFMVMACGTRVGMHRENHEAEATLPGLGTVSGVRTDVWTERAGGGVHTYSRNRTADVTLGQAGLGSLELTAITSLSHAWHDSSGFHAETKTNIGGITFTPPTGPAQTFELPTPDQPIEIPGLAKIAVGRSTARTTAHSGVAIADALNITLIPTGTRLRIAHTTAQVLDGVRHGTFHGYSAGSRITALDDNVTSGRTPLSMMPCQGTEGKLRTKTIADVNAGDQIILQGLSSAEQGTQAAHRSVALERGKVAELNLGGGSLVIKAVVGQANVSRNDRGKVVSSAKGTQFASITANGQEQSFPDTGVIEIPGLAKIERSIIDKTKYGISVVALRVTLLDGTGAVIDLGVAKAAIRPRSKH